jgi:hypothetical protein
MLTSFFKQRSMCFMTLTLQELSETDSRFYQQLEVQIERVVRANISEDQRLIAIGRIVNGIHTSLTSPEYRPSVIVTPSRLPRIVDDISIEFLANLQSNLRQQGVSEPRMREILEKAEHGALIKQQHREGIAIRYASESVDSAV